MDRREYELTDGDRQKAAGNATYREAQLAEIEANRDDKAYWKRRRTTYGLAKRGVTLLANAGDPDYHEGRGQGMLDVMSGLLYTDERRSAAYNQGYHDGYSFSYGEMQGYVEKNPNFAHLVVLGRSAIGSAVDAARKASEIRRAERWERQKTEAQAIAVVIDAPGYNEEFVAAIKRIPGRLWDADRRRWSVPPEQEARARKLVAKHFPAPKTLSVPKSSPAPARSATRVSAPVAALAPAAPRSAPVFAPQPAPVRKSLPYGQLWEECFCGTEPVCVQCENCDRHCRCPQPLAPSLSGEIYGGDQ